MQILTFGKLLNQVHPDLKNLLWRSNQIKAPKKLKLYGVEFVLSETEPSLIPESFETEEVEKIEDALPLQGLPFFSGFSPDQKYVYTEFLRNPYDGSFPQYYVFLLQCGLERQILCGKAEEAFNVMFKLRDAYKEQCSARHFSARCILYMSAISNNRKLFDRAMNSFILPDDLEIVQDVYMFAKYKLDRPLTASDLMEMSNKFGFKNKGYINGYPKLFEETLTELMIERTRRDTLPLKKYVSSYKNGEPTCFGSPFANKSIMYTEEKINKEKCDKFVFELLGETHSRVKRKLAELRKAGAAPEKMQPHKQRKAKMERISEIALAKMENKVTESFAEALKSNSIREQYDAACNLCRYYFDYRRYTPSYSERCIEYGKLCLELLPKSNAEATGNNNKELEKCRKDFKHYSDIDDDFMMSIMQNRIDMLTRGSISDIEFPCLWIDEMITVYKEKGDFLSAADIYDYAIEYYSTAFSKSRIAFLAEKKADELKKKKERLLKQ